MTRNESRDQALKIVFQHHFNSTLSAQEIAALNNEADDIETDEFALNLSQNVIDHKEEIDGIISSKLVRWTMERLPLVSVAILRLGVAEILYGTGVPDAVIANEAVDFAKKYIGTKEASFINGVLGSVIKDKNPDAALPATEEAAEETETETAAE